jgi:hypothetical protein
MRSITLGIPDQAATQLAQLARRDYRRPRDQATVLLLEAIARAADDRPDRQDAAGRSPAARSPETV